MGAEAWERVVKINLIGTAAVVRAAREEADAASLYDESLKPIRKNIRRRLFFFPIMNSGWGKYLGGCMPTPLISKVTEWL